MCDVVEKEWRGRNWKWWEGANTEDEKMNLSKKIVINEFKDQVRRMIFYLFILFKMRCNKPLEKWNKIVYTYEELFSSFSLPLSEAIERNLSFCFSNHFSFYFHWLLLYYSFVHFFVFILKKLLNNEKWFSSFHIHYEDNNKNISGIKEHHSELLFSPFLGTSIISNIYKYIHQDQIGIYICFKWVLVVDLMLVGLLDHPFRSLRSMCDARENILKEKWWNIYIYMIRLNPFFLQLHLFLIIILLHRLIHRPLVLCKIV